MTGEGAFSFRLNRRIPTNLNRPPARAVEQATQSTVDVPSPVEIEEKDNPSPEVGKKRQTWPREQQLDLAAYMASAVLAANNEMVIEQVTKTRRRHIRRGIECDRRIDAGTLPNPKKFSVLAPDKTP